MPSSKSSTLVDSLVEPLSTSPLSSVRTMSPAHGRPRVQTRGQSIAEYPFHTNLPFIEGRRRSFLAALAGVAYVARTQPNVWIELAAVGVVVAGGWWFGIAPVEWAILMMTFGLILALEAVNTAIETVVDLVSPGYHPLAKIAKDTAAGALLLAVIASVAVAAFIFGPRLLALL